MSYGQKKVGYTNMKFKIIIQKALGHEEKKKMTVRKKHLTYCLIVCNGL